MTDAALRAQGAEGNGFDAECERLRPLGESYVLRRFGGQLNHADAQDAVAEVLIRLHQRASRGETPENLRAAFFTSVRNQAIDQLRARGRRPAVALEAADGLPADGVPPGEYAEGREEAAVLVEALATMRRKYREAILLRFGVGLTIAQIAERQQMSLEGTKKLVMRATRQAKERLLAVTSASHCEAMQTRAKRQLFDRYLAEVASDEEVAQLERHLEHCGRCKSVVVSLHHSLHEVAAGALVSTGVADQLTEKASLADHLGGWIANAGDASHVGVEKARVASFKVGNALQGGEAATGGALAGTGQKIAALCATGAAAASCVGAGVVGPGVAGVDVIKVDGDSSAKERTVVDEQLPTTTTPATPAATTPDEQPAESASIEPQTSVEHQRRELGIEAAPTSSPSGGSNEFGGASGSGGGISKSSGSGGGGFGIE